MTKPAPAIDSEYTHVFLSGPDPANPHALQVTNDDPPYNTPWGVQTAMRPDQALLAIEYLKTHEPTDWADYLNLTSAFFLAGRDDEAMRMAERAVELHRVTPTLLNLAICLEMHGRFEEAFPLCEEAHLMDLNDGIAGGLYGDALIRRGEWAKGWPIHTKYHHGLSPLRDYLPEWDGRSSLHNRRILVLEGGGYGDNLLCLRWLATLKIRGAARVTYCVQKSLIPLLAAQPNRLGADSFLPSIWEEIRTNRLCTLDLSAYDCFISALALPEVAGAIPSDLHSPLGYPYIFADPSKSAALHGTFHPSFGLCWQAGEGAYPRKYKSLSVAQTSRILHTNGINWVSLQYDAAPPVGAAAGAAEVQIPPLRDWSDTAAVIDNLDLVVTVDTGVAHLAGAMGKKTFLILPGRSSWPFGLNSDQSLLYPSVRLFRNHGLGIDNAVDSVIRALRYQR